MKVKSCCLIGMLLFPSLGHAFESRTLPSREIDLSDWGISDPSEIGFASVGLRHDKKGDEVVVYDIRKTKPVLTEPAGPRGKVPPYQGDYFLLGRFDRGNVNRLGGYFNSFVRSPSKVSLAIGDVPDKTRALTFSYRNAPPGFAGFWIHLFDSKLSPAGRVYMDATPFSYLTFSVRGEKGGEALLLKSADRVWEKKEDSVEIGDLASFLPSKKIETRWQEAWVPLIQFPAALNRKELASIVLQVKGAGAGRVFIKDLAFTKTKEVAIPPAQMVEKGGRSYRKALWLWETDKILPDITKQDQLIAFARSQGLTDIFMQIPYEAKKEGDQWKILWNPSNLPAFLKKLHQAGLTVHALDGDPDYALRESHGRVLALIEEMIGYNRDKPAEERFDGIRYDNEIYLSPSFGGVRKESIMKQYLELLEKSHALTEKGGMTLGADIPFWFDGQNEFYEPVAAVGGRPLSERIIDRVDNIGVMDYRTAAYGADGTIAHAWSEMEYAAKKGKKVFVGLDTVALPDETLCQFGMAKGKGSEIVIEKLAGGKARLTLVSGAPEGEETSSRGIVLHQQSLTSIPSEKLTFAKKNSKDLEEVIRQTRDELGQFPSFFGIAIHSYESYRPWLERK